MLVGRDGERARLRVLLDGVHAGRGGALVVRGEPGIGKTALLDDLRAAAAGVRVLAARGIEAESHLAFAGLADVLRPVLDLRARLPPAQRAALEAALALGPPAVPDRFAAYAATLGLLTAAAAREPLLVLVDDAHWLDTPSQEALLFAARRLADDPVAIVATSREVPARELDASAVDELRLAPLGDAAARRVLADRGRDLAPDVVDALLQAAAGNPLALIELSRALTDEEGAGRVALPRPLRTGEGLMFAFRGLVGRLGPGARRAALIAATADDGRPQVVLAALGTLGGGAGDLAAAEEAGMVALDDGRVRLRHPVLRTVVIQLSAPDERRRAHRALAAALDPRRDAEQRAWHLAEATVGPDPEAAAALDEAARRAAARTGYAAGARALERASALTADPVAAAGRRIGAARLAMAAGRFGWSRALLDDLGGVPPAVAADAAHLRGVLTLRTSDPARAADALVRDGAAVAGHDPVRAAVMMADAVLAHSLVGHCRDALRTAQRAYGLARAAGTVPPSVLGYLGGALTLRGRAREARGLLDALDRASAAVDSLTIEGQTLALSQVWRIWIGDYARELRRMEAIVERARAAGAVGFLAYPLAWVCELGFRTGRWDRARADGEEARALLIETGQESLVAYALCALGMVEAGLGLTEAARERAAAALEQGTRVNAGNIRLYAASVLAFAALGDGDAAAAAGVLDPLLPVMDEMYGLLEPATVPWQPDMIEALVRLGRAGDARRALATLAEQAHRTGGTWARAVTCRCRGLIDDDIDRHFGEALALHALSPTPFERARTELAYGARLRRAGRRTEARAQLGRALATFDALGARPWARQAREEIAASGARLRPRGPGPAGEELSPRELQVALTVAEGATNREAAARLFLSEKTIERHLGSVYRKLGVRSRTQLARRMAAPDAGAQAGREAPGEPTVTSESQ